MIDGDSEGSKVGFPEGFLLGKYVGSLLGFVEGVRVGLAVGEIVLGLADG